MKTTSCVPGLDFYIIIELVNYTIIEKNYMKSTLHCLHKQSSIILMANTFFHRLTLRITRCFCLCFE